MDRSSRQTVNKKTLALSDKLGQMDLIDIFRAFHPKVQNILHILYKYKWNVSRLNHMLGHKPSLSKFKKIEIILSIFSYDNAMKLEINTRTLKKKKGYRS